MVLRDGSKATWHFLSKVSINCPFFYKSLPLRSMMQQSEVEVQTILKLYPYFHIFLFYICFFAHAISTLLLTHSIPNSKSNQLIILMLKYSGSAIVYNSLLVHLLKYSGVLLPYATRVMYSGSTAVFKHQTNQY